MIVTASVHGSATSWAKLKIGFPSSLPCGWAKFQGQWQTSFVCLYYGQDVVKQQCGRLLKMTKPGCFWWSDGIWGLSIRVTHTRLYSKQCSFLTKPAAYAPQARMGCSYQGQVDEVEPCPDQNVERQQNRQPGRWHSVEQWRPICTASSKSTQWTGNASKYLPMWLCNYLWDAEWWVSWRLLTSFSVKECSMHEEIHVEHVCTYIDDRCLNDTLSTYVIAHMQNAYISL